MPNSYKRHPRIMYLLIPHWGNFCITATRDRGKDNAKNVHENKILTAKRKYITSLLMGSGFRVMIETMFRPGSIAALLSLC